MRFTAERDEVERRWLADPPASASAFEQADELLRRWTRGLPAITDARPWWARRYWQDRDRRAGLDTASARPTTHLTPMGR
jgi:secernin